MWFDKPIKLYRAMIWLLHQQSPSEARRNPDRCRPRVDTRLASPVIFNRTSPDFTIRAAQSSWHRESLTICHAG